VRILGIHREPWHDTGAAVLVEDCGGVEIVSITQERLDRVKDSRAFPGDAIDYCLKASGMSSLDEIDLVVSDYIEPAVAKQTQTLPPEKIAPEKMAIINHHQAHAAGAFYSSPFDEAAVLVVDGRGSDKETQSLFTASRESGVRLLEKSGILGLGLLYATVTVKIGFGILNEGKTMGLAPYGGGSRKDIIDWPSIRRYSGIHTDYTGLCHGRYDMRPALPPMSDDVRARLAFEVQREIEHGMLYLARRAREITGMKNLCISGGVGLNSVANNRIVQEKIFDGVFIHPACSDTGIPLGCALHGYHHILSGRGRFNFNNAHMGRAYTPGEMDCAIKSSAGFRVCCDDDDSKTVELLTDNKVLGWFQGGSEIGPRALGNRSILMNPGRAENKDHLNERVKHRENFRPFAPAVIGERAGEYFDLDRPSPFMLLVADVLPGAREKIPAVTHIDGTARVQTVSMNSNPAFYRLMEKFGEATGTPVLLNTSFNVAGEPVVETPDDAIRCFLSTGIDALRLGKNLLLKDAA
jgi:carbamoyltransferase